ncbi:hypothetical protein EVA_13715 [gut metagenome]|uniref:Uncharacterized protein n=1 Tax=gut metagenome TaxID=749906 RepID=J9GFR6_9ZZZZ
MKNGRTGRRPGCPAVMKVNSQESWSSQWYHRHRWSSSSRRPLLDAARVPH